MSIRSGLIVTKNVFDKLTELAIEEEEGVDKVSPFRAYEYVR